MALTDNNEAFRPRIPVPPSRGLQPSALKALARLPQIHAETSQTADLARFVRSAVAAAAALTLLGILAVSLAGGASLKQEFAWSLLVLAGVGAMLRSYIKSTAQAFDRAPLREAAQDLRAVLFYTGFAWGAGAFLFLGDNPLPILGLCFAVLPCVFLMPLLRDRAASLCFLLPVTVLTAAAIILERWSGTATALVMLLVVQGSIAAGLALPGRTRASLPAGLSLH